MAGALRKTMLYLGLAEDRAEEYQDEYESYEEQPLESAVSLTPLRETNVTPLRREVATMATHDEGSLKRITTVHPTAYNDALIIGEAFRNGTPVIMNLSNMDDANAKRLVDFAAGLTFGLHGAIEKVTNKVFLLSPQHIEVSSQERETAKNTPAGFYNQS